MNFEWKKATTPEGIRQYHLFADGKHVFTVEGAEDEWSGENLLTGETGEGCDTLRETKEWAKSEIESRGGGS